MHCTWGFTLHGKQAFAGVQQVSACRLVASRLLHRAASIAGATTCQPNIAARQPISRPDSAFKHGRRAGGSSYTFDLVLT